MTPALARKTLLAQHHEIRAYLARCAALSTQYLDHGMVADDLAAELQELRRSIAVHNDAENALIRILLVHSNRWGEKLIERMLVEHLAEHEALWTLLTGAIADVAPRIPELVEALDAHMLAEERTFLSSQVLYSDEIERHRR